MKIETFYRLKSFGLNYFSILKIKLSIIIPDYLFNNNGSQLCGVSDPLFTTLLTSFYGGHVAKTAASALL